MGDKLVIGIEKTGSLYFLLNAFIGAYNRRTDVIQRINETDPQEIARLTAKLKQSSDALKEAVEQHKGDLDNG